MPGFTLHPLGRFSLHSAATFAERFPGTEADLSAGELRFAWPVDGDWQVVAVKLSQRGDEVRGELETAPPRDLARLARRDAERILSLDVDGVEYERLGDHDPVIGVLQRRFAGLRPVLFYSPYEAAAWTIIGQRIRMVQAAAVKRRLSAELGTGGAFPAPARLATITAPQRGLSTRKIEQLRAVAAAAQDGLLTRDRLRGLRFEDAVADLQRLPGIGPFSAELIVIRGVGAPDALPDHERRVQRAIRTAYGLAPDADVRPIAEAWRPYRSWCALLLRRWLEAETQEIATGRRATSDPAPIV